MAIFAAAQVASRAAAIEGVAVGFEPVQCGAVERDTAALVDHFPVPVQAKALQGPENPVCTTGYDPRRIEVLDADQPLPSVMAGIEIAPYCGKE